MSKEGESRDDVEGSSSAPRSSEPSVGGDCALLEILRRGEGAAGKHRESKTTITDMLPPTLVNAAMRLNEFIYTGCEKMECTMEEEEEDDDEDQSSIDDTTLEDGTTLDGTLEGTLDRILSSSVDETLDTTTVEGTQDETVEETVDSKTLEGTLEDTVEETIDSNSMTKSKDSFSILADLESKSLTEKNEFSVSSLNLQPVSEKEHIEKSKSGRRPIPGYEGAKRIEVSTTDVSKAKKLIPIRVVIEEEKPKANCENQKPPGGSFRKMKRSISKFIRPSKGNITESEEELLGDKTEHLRENTERSKRSSRASNLEKINCTEADEFVPSRRFQRSIHNETSKSSNNVRQVEENQKNQSCRTRSILDDRNTLSKEGSFSGRLFVRSIFRKKADRDEKGNQDNSKKKVSVDNADSNSKGTAESTGKIGSGSFLMSSSSVKSSRIRKSGHDRYTPKAENMIVASPTNSTKASSNISSAAAADTYVLLAPNQDGQEIALHDENYYYHDPAQVHSLLTMPTLESFNPRMIEASRSA